MECKHAQEWLSAWLDGELDAAGALQLQTHVDNCSSCRAAQAQLQALRGDIAQQATRYAAPPHLKHRIHAALQTEQQRQQQRPIWRRFASWPWAWINLAAAGASTAALALTLTLQAGQLSGSEQLERELVASHIRALMPDHLADVASTDQHTVKPWFAGKLDFSPPVVDLAQQGYTLIGGRLDYLNQRPVAALAYRHRQHIMNLYIWPEPAQPDMAPLASSRQGYQLLRWRQDGMQFSAVADMNGQDLRDFAHLLHDRASEPERPR